MSREAVFIDFLRFTLISGGFEAIWGQKVGQPVAPCGALWRPVAGCGNLWRKAVAPIYYHARSLGLAGWQDSVWSGRLAGWLDGWMAGWLDGRLAGWLDGWMVGITAVT